MKVAGYIRVSTDSEGQKESPENQKQLIFDFLKERDYDLFHFYTDVQTGTNDNREGLKNLIADAENNKFDVIVAKELSRLGRNVGLLYQLKKIAETKGIRIITLDGRVDTQDASKQAMFGLYAWMYENESQRTSERIKSVFQMKYKNGKFLGAHAPYGYTVRDGKLIIRDDYTVDVVRDIYSKYLEGWGHDKIARFLSNKQLPTPSTVLGKSNASKYWQGTSIKKILQNPHYVGDLVQGRETTLNVTNKKRVLLNEEDWVVMPNTHEPIISRELFEEAKHLLAMRARRGRGRTKAPKHLFTNIAYCSDCGKGMWYRSNRKGYICGTYARHGNIACTNHAVKEQNLIEAILNDLKAMYNKLNLPDLDAKVKQRINANEKKMTKQLQAIDKQVQKQMDLKKNALQKFVNDDITKDDYDDLVTYVQDTLQLLESEKRELKKMMDESHSVSKLSAIKEQLKNAVTFDTLTTEMLLRFIEKIEVKEDKSIKIYYKFAMVEGL